MSEIKLLRTNKSNVNELMVNSSAVTGKIEVRKGIS